jgi:hypothetical protein
MGIAHEQQGAGLKHGKIKGDALAELVVVHVAAIVSQFVGTKGLSPP